MTLEELKSLFKNNGFHVWDEENIVILYFERKEDGMVLHFDDLNHILAQWDYIIANRANDPFWDNILNKLGITNSTNETSDTSTNSTSDTSETSA